MQIKSTPMLTSAHAEVSSFAASLMSGFTLGAHRSLQIVCRAGEIVERACMAVLPRRFSSQIASSFFVLGVILASALSIGLGNMLAASSRHEAEISLVGAADSAASSVSEGLSQRLIEVQSLATAPSQWSDGLGSEKVSQALSRAQAMHPFTAWVGVGDVDGVVRASTGNLMIGMGAKTNPWFAGAALGPSISDPQEISMLARVLATRRSGVSHRFIAFSAPVHREGRFAGVVGLQMSSEWVTAMLTSQLPEQELRRGLELFVFDRRGEIIFTGEGSLTGERLPDALTAGVIANASTETNVESDAGPAPIVTKAGVTKAGVTKASVLRWRDGRSYLTAVIRVQPRMPGTELGWTVVARKPVEEAYAGANSAAGLALVIGLLGATLTGMLGWLIADRLARPLERIAEDVRRLEVGGTTGKGLVVQKGSIEVERLSGALVSMTTRLQEMNQELEARVHERTAELRQANLALEHMAQHDPLTGLRNRRGFDEGTAMCIAAARRMATPLSVLTLDADRFKTVNDSFGHEAGDLVLKTIARVLSSRLRATDILARTGGEEFVAVLVNTGLEDATEVAQSLVDAVREAIIPGVGSVTISCGVTELRVERESMECALRRADAALYRAKESGRDRVCGEEVLARA